MSSYGLELEESAGCISLYDRVIGMENSVEYLHWKVGTLWKDGDCSNVKRQMGSRAGYVLFIIPNLVTSIACAVIGSGYALGALAKGGTDDDLNERAYKLLHLHRQALSQIYEPILQGFNPDADFSDTRARNIFHDREEFRSKVLCLKPEINGIFTGFLLDFIDRHIATPCRESQNIFVQHVVTRAVHLLSIPFVVIARVVDFAIGLLAAFFSLLTMGVVERSCSIAYNGLQITGIVNDIFCLVLQTINPWAELPV